MKHDNIGLEFAAPHVRMPARAGGGDAGGLPILLRYTRILLRWRWYIIGAILLSLAIGLLTTLLMTPRYTATATVEISRQRSNIVNVKGVEPEASGADLEFYQTQYSLLQARSLAERVVTALRLASDDSFFQAFDADVSAGMFGSKAARSSPLAERERRQRAATDILLANITISPTRGSSLVAVSFTSPDPVLSQRVANSWTAEFIQSSLDRRFEANSYARRFLESRLADLRQRLEESERNAVQFAANQRIINLPTSELNADGRSSSERSLASIELERLTAALSQATADRVTAQSRPASNGGATAEGLANVALGSMRQKRAELQGEYANLLTKFEPSYPTARALASQISALDQSIRQEESRIGQAIGGNLNATISRERELRSRVEQLKNEVLDQRRRTIQYNIFQRDADTNRQLYDALLQRYKEIGIAGGVGTNNVAVVDPAIVPPQPSSPRLVPNMLLALLFGIALAAAGTFALEQIDEGIKDPTDVGRLLSMPSLGAVPEELGHDPIDLLADRKSYLSEAYLSVQTNLSFSTDHGVPHSIAVTSTRASEGKSVTSFAIAKSLRQTGRQPILVDADMRSPSVHGYLNLDNVRGLSNFLAGEDDLDSLVVRSDDGMAVITAGPQPPNAAELLTGPRLRLLIEKLLERFDHVIIDSPPVLGLADAPLIGSAAEAIVYVVRAHGPRASIIRSAIERMHAASSNLVGVVLTRFDAKRAHLGYGYDYGYGYGASKSPTEQD